MPGLDSSRSGVSGRRYGVAVVGGADMDFTVRAPMLPEPGGSVQGDAFLESPGGKGVNQAVAAARLGGRVALLACVGKDGHGEVILERLHQEQVDARFVVHDSSAPTGATVIQVDARGRKQTANAPGANRRLAVMHVLAAAEVLRSASILLAQLEPPLEVVRAAAEIARAAGARVVLDSGPAMPVPDGVLRLADVVRSDAVEAQALTGVLPRDRLSARHAAELLLARGPAAASIEAQEAGDLVLWRDGECWLPHLPVEPVDTTGAGDAFAAALAVALAEGHALAEAGQFANAAAALATTRLGALPGLPRREEVEALRRQRALSAP